MFMTRQTNRIKRGFFDFICDLSKTLFGTLDKKNVQYYNEKLDKLRSDNVETAHIIKNQTNLILNS